MDIPPFLTLLQPSVGELVCPPAFYYSSNFYTDKTQTLQKDNIDEMHVCVCLEK
jgi:hypothetical protein